MATLSHHPRQFPISVLHLSTHKSTYHFSSKRHDLCVFHDDNHHHVLITKLFFFFCKLDGFPKLVLNFTFLKCLSSDQCMGRIASHFLEFELKARQSRYSEIILIWCTAQKYPDITFAFVGIQETFEKMSTSLSFSTLFQT